MTQPYKMQVSIKKVNDINIHYGKVPMFTHHKSKEVRKCPSEWFQLSFSSFSLLSKFSFSSILLYHAFWFYKRTLWYLIYQYTSTIYVKATFSYFRTAFECILSRFEFIHKEDNIKVSFWFFRYVLTNNLMVN